MDEIERALEYRHDVGFDEGYEQGYEQGFQDGYEIGFTQGFEDAEYAMGGGDDSNGEDGGQGDERA